VVSEAELRKAAAGRCLCCMAADSNAVAATAAYNQLSKEQQEEFGKIVVEKLRGSIGVHGELSVLAEYIQVMLQSNRPPDQIEGELTAFLTNESGPFTKWLFLRILEFADAHQAAGGAAVKKKTKRKKKEKDAPPEATGGTAALHAAATATAPAARSRSRRRRRRESAAAEATAGAARVLRDALPAGRTDALPESREQAGRSGGNKDGGGESRKAVLTPNVQYLREVYHNKVDPVVDREDARERGGPGPGPGESSPPGGKWHFRMEHGPGREAGPPPPGYFPPPHGAPPHYREQPPPGAHMPGAPPHPHMPGGPPHAAGPPGAYGHHHPPPGPYGAAPPTAAGPPPATSQGLPPAAQAPQAPAVEQPPGPRPKSFNPKKWRVFQDNTVVRLSMHLDSDQVCFLRKGEIIEQVAPQFTLSNGIIRLLIRHPSSPSFPNPIGWVTLDASSAGGPRFLEPGPEPMVPHGHAPRGPGGGPGGAPPRDQHSAGGCGGGPVASSRGGSAPPMVTSAPWRPGGGPCGGGAPMYSSPSYPPRPHAPAAVAATAPRGASGAFQNLTWRPSAAAAS